MKNVSFLLYSILRNDASSASENMSVTVADCPAYPSFTQQRRNESSRTWSEAEQNQKYINFPIREVLGSINSTLHACKSAFYSATSII